MHHIALALALAFLSFDSALAGPAFFSAGIVIADDDQTPRERLASGAGAAQGGIHDVNDPSKCSQTARERALGPKWYSNGWVFKKEKTRRIARKDLQLAMQKPMQEAVTALVRHGDSELLSRQVCVGTYAFGSETAASIREGYFAVDPSLVFRIRSEAKNPQASLLAENALYLHGLAHQFQYAHGNPFIMDFNHRRTELVAGCMSSALLALRNFEVPEVFESQAPGIVAAVRDVSATIEDGRHAGTEIEREAAAHQGVSLVRSSIRFYRSTGYVNLTSQSLVTMCTRFVKDQDQDFGSNWPRITDSSK